VISLKEYKHDNVNHAWENFENKYSTKVRIISEPWLFGLVPLLLEKTLQLEFRSKIEESTLHLKELLNRIFVIDSIGLFCRDALAKLMKNPLLSLALENSQIVCLCKKNCLDSLFESFVHFYVIRSNKSEDYFVLLVCQLIFASLVFCKISSTSDWVLI